MLRLCAALLVSCGAALPLLVSDKPPLAPTFGVGSPVTADDVDMLFEHTSSPTFGVASPVTAADVDMLFERTSPTSSRAPPPVPNATRMEATGPREIRPHDPPRLVIVLSHGRGGSTIVSEVLAHFGRSSSAALQKELFGQNDEHMRVRG